MSPSERLALPLGEAIFTLRAVRKFKPDAIADEDLAVILLAAGRAPSARNGQPWHFLVVKDPGQKGELQDLLKRDWWGRRGRVGISTHDDVPSEDQPTVLFLDRLAETPVLILACATSTRIANEVLAAAQLLLLAARGLGIGGTLMRFGPTTDLATNARLNETFGLPEEAKVEYIIPLGYPQGSFGPVKRRPLREIVSLDRWGAPAPFAN